jgi:hypothetical protein
MYHIPVWRHRTSRCEPSRVHFIAGDMNELTLTLRFLHGSQATRTTCPRIGLSLLCTSRTLLYYRRTRLVSCDPVRDSGVVRQALVRARVVYRAWIHLRHLRGGEEISVRTQAYPGPAGLIRMTVLRNESTCVSAHVRGKGRRSSYLMPATACGDANARSFSPQY